jgi:phosphohistidine phosphatase SixA
MIVLLMRHADREPSTSERYERDLPLTSRGMRDVESVALQLVQKLVDYPPVAHTLSSPHRAAIETARQILDALGVEDPPMVDKTLDPDVTHPRDPRGIIAIIDALPAKGESVTFIVGHQPLLGELGRKWTGQRVSPVRAGIACIDRGKSEARLLWMLEP